MAPSVFGKVALVCGSGGSRLLEEGELVPSAEAAAVVWGGWRSPGGAGGLRVRAFPY